MRTPETGDTVIFRTRGVNRSGEVSGRVWLLTGEVMWSGGGWVWVECPGPDHAKHWPVRPSDIAWVCGEISPPDDDRRTTAADTGPAADTGRYLAPGSYGDHADPRDAMARLSAERARVTGLAPVRVRAHARAAIAQLGQWMSSPTWAILCPPGHHIGRHPGNFLEIGVWADE